MRLVRRLDATNGDSDEDPADHHRNRTAEVIQLFPHQQPQRPTVAAPPATAPKSDPTPARPHSLRRPALWMVLVLVTLVGGVGIGRLTQPTAKPASARAPASTAAPTPTAPAQPVPGPAPRKPPAVKPSAKSSPEATSSGAGAAPRAGGTPAPAPAPRVQHPPTSTPPPRTAPPTTAPARVVVPLGGFSGDKDLNHWCIHLGYKEAFTSKGPDVARNNWICRGSISNPTQPQSGYIGFVPACRWAYQQTIAKAEPTDENNAYTWVCYGYQ